MVDRPDLPGLERVRSCRVSSEADTWFLALIFLPVLLLMAAYAYLGRPLVRNGAPVLGVALGAIVLAFISLAALGGLIMLVRSRFYFCWKTSGDGLSVRGVLHTRFIAWSDVTSVRVNDGARFCAERYVVRAGESAVAIPDYDAKLVASLWQHLRRVGKADSITLPDTASAYWTPVPDDIPNEITWYNPRPPITALVRLKLLFIALFAIAGLVFAFTIQSLGLAAMILLLMMGNRLREVRVRQATGVDVKEPGLEAETAFGRMSLPWERVLAASCTLDGIYLTISPFKALFIPRAKNDALIMAIVRHLRSLEKPLPVSLPDGYVQAWAGVA